MLHGLFAFLVHASLHHCLYLFTHLCITAPPSVLSLVSPPRRLHEFDLQCNKGAADEYQRAWERVPLSPYEGADSEVARMLKPYIWLQRRFVSPGFREDPYRPSQCPNEANPDLANLLLPPANFDVAGEPPKEKRVDINRPLA